MHSYTNRNIKMQSYQRKSGFYSFTWTMHENSLFQRLLAASYCTRMIFVKWHWRHYQESNKKVGEKASPSRQSPSNYHQTSFEKRRSACFILVKCQMFHYFSKLCELYMKAIRDCCRNEAWPINGEKDVATFLSICCGSSRCVAATRK